MRRFLRQLALVSVLFAAGPLSHAVAADAKVETEAKKLQGDAMDVDFLSTDFKAAKKKLEAALKKCGESKCSAALVAALRRDLGVVQVNAKDVKAGQASFEAALAADAGVTISKDYLADANVKAAWEAAKKKVGASAAPTPDGDADGDAPPPPKKKKKKKPETETAPAPDGDGGEDGAEEAPPPKKKKKPPIAETEEGTLEIEFKKSPVGYAYPIVVKVPDDLGVVVVKISYKSASMEKFKAVEAKLDGERFVATIGCEDTQFVGDIKIYVRAYDDEKNEVDHLGTAKKPVAVTVVDKLAAGEEAPTYPGGKAPDKCVEKGDCQPGFPCDTADKKPAGSGCDKDDECQRGLSCVPNLNGTNWCADTASEGDGSGDPDASKKKPGKFKRIWFGFDLQQDILFLGAGDDLCNDASWACTNGSGDVGNYVDGSGAPLNSLALKTGFGGKTNGGAALGTTRFLLTLDYFLSDKISLGVRLGYAFRGNPSTNAPFMPFHAEVRAHYFFSSIATVGFKPFLTLGGGLGEFDAALPNVVVATSNPADSDGTPCSADGPATCLGGVKAYRLAGKGFIGAGLGFWYLVSPTVALDVGARFILPLPTFSLGIAPELGLKIGF